MPNKFITCDDKDPVWMNENIKSRIKSKNLFYKQYTQNVLEKLITELNELISSTKALYYENIEKKKSNNPLLQVKTYWSILKTFYNNKKIPLIPPLLIETKICNANIFNKFFAEQCTPLKNGSILPSSLEFLTQERLCSLNFSNDEILKLIRFLNVHKAHRYDDISTRMIKRCEKSLIKPIIILFQISIKSSHYPDI